MKNLIKFLLFSILIISCDTTEKQNTDTKAVIVREIIVKDSSLQDSVLQLNKRYNNLNSNLSSTLINQSKLKEENKQLMLVVDSLKNRIVSLNKSQKQNKKQNNKESINPEIEKLIRDITKAWDNLPVNRDTKSIVKFFSSKYRCNRISIDHDNTAQISWHDENDFDDYMNAIIKKKKWSYKSFNIVVLDTEVKGNTYFNSSYKYSLNTYDGDRLIDKSNFQVTITGKRIKGKFKIVNYSWVRFSYM